LGWVGLIQDFLVFSGLHWVGRLCQKYFFIGIILDKEWNRSNSHVSQPNLKRACFYLLTYLLTYLFIYLFNNIMWLSISRYFANIVSILYRYRIEIENVIS